MMGNVLQMLVECYRGNDLLATYELGVPRTLAGPPIVDEAALIKEAKDQLTTDRLAYPPYEGIRFKVRPA